MLPTPIVIAAFGSARARTGYTVLDARIRARFPEHEILWAWSSRVINKTGPDQQQNPAFSPQEVLERLSGRHHAWAVVQSLHLLGGHEFIRLVEETGKSPIRTSIGLPLLSSPADYQALCASLAPLINTHPDQAILLVGHGTDHPAWCAYPALQYFMQRQFGPRVFVGVIEECVPSSTEVIADLITACFTEVCIIPLLLVAGMHFFRDLAGSEQDSWMSRLGQADIKVEIIEQGLGILPAISDIFCRHIENALTIIPDSTRQNKKQDLSGHVP